MRFLSFLSIVLFGSTVWSLHTKPQTIVATPKVSAPIHRIALVQEPIEGGLSAYQKRMCDEEDDSSPFSIPTSWVMPIRVNREYDMAIIDTGSSDVVIYTDEKKASTDTIELSYLSETVHVQRETALLQIGTMRVRTTVGWSNGKKMAILGLGDPSLSRLSNDTLLSKIPFFVLSHSPHRSWFDTKLRSSDYEGKMYYVSVDEFWKTKVHRILLDRQPMPMEETWLHVDSGTSIIRGPSDKILSLLTSLKTYIKDIKDCSHANVQHLPTLAFEVDTGLRLEIEPMFYMIMMEGKCLPAFGSSGNDDWIVGGPFLYKFVTVFDAKKKQMGFGLSPYAANQCARAPRLMYPPFFTDSEDEFKTIITKMDTTRSLQAKKINVIAIPTTRAPIQMVVASVASSAGGASSSANAVTVTRATTAPTKAPTAAPTKKYACN
jgi:hypothetical protein